MNKIDMIKAAGELIVSIGVTAIVNNVVRATTPIDTKPLKKFCIVVGGFVLADMIGSKVVDYTEEKMNTAITKVESMMTKC